MKYHEGPVVRFKIPPIIATVRNGRLYVGCWAMDFDIFLVCAGPSESIEWDESPREQAELDFYWSNGRVCP